MRKTASCAAILVLTVLPVVSAQQETSLVLVDKGSKRAVIVVPRDAPEEIERAAAEMQQYIRDITGAALPVVNPDRVAEFAGSIRLHVGLNPLIEDSAPDLDKCEKDGYWIKTLPDRALLIAGKTPYGTEFAVYGFLQRFCGVRWYLPGPNGTFVPRQATLTVPHVELLDNPSFISRHFYAPTFWDNPNFACRAALEMDQAWYRHNRMRKHFENHHNLGRVVIPLMHGSEHPEYFPAIGDKRKVPASNRPVGFQPCMTNAEVVKLCTDAAARHFDENPDAMSYSIGINDHGGFCECAGCGAANGPARLNSRGLPDFSRLLLQFGNRVAAQLPARHKDRYVGLLAYAQARDLPPDMEVHPNLLIGRVTAFVAYFNPMDRKDMQETKRFAQKCRMLGVYDYVYGTFYAVPVLCTGLLEEYLDFLAGLGVKGWSSETYQNWSMDGIKYYLLAQKLWNPSLRMHDLLAEYCRNMFGHGADEMLHIHQLCRERWETQAFATSKYHLGGSVQQAALFDTETCAELFSLMEQARAKTSDPQGKFLIDRFADTLAYPQAHAALLQHSLRIADKGLRTSREEPHGPHREETLIPEDQFQAAVEDIVAYEEHTLGALRALQQINSAREKIRRNAFSLPRKSLGSMGGMFKTPETICAPFFTACNAVTAVDAKQRFLATAAEAFPEFMPRVQWTADHLAGMEGEPELLPNSSFETLGPNHYDALGWLHGNWGSFRSTANAFVVPQGIDGDNCYYLVGVKNAFTYLPAPVIKLAEPLPVEAGKWYLMRAKVRSHRNDGLLPMPAFYLQFPGATPSSLACSLAPGNQWYDAVWLLQTPAKAKTVVVRFKGTDGEGQTWVDALSLKRVPDAMAPEGAEGVDRLVTYPPLQVEPKLPDPLTVDFASPVPPGVFTYSGTKEAGKLISSEGYIVFHILWTFGSAHDLEFELQAASADGTTLGVYALEEAPAAGNRWVKVGRCSFDPFRRPLKATPTTFTFRYRYRDPARRLRFLVYRSNKKGTLELLSARATPLPAETLPDNGQQPRKEP